MNNLDCSSDYCIKKLVEKYNVVGQIDLRSVESINHYHLQLQINKLWKEQYQADQRIIIIMDQDWYASDNCGNLLESLVQIVNQIDISNFFITLITTNPDIEKEYQWVHNNLDVDSVSWEIYQVAGEWQRYTNTDNVAKSKSQMFYANFDKLSTLEPRYTELLEVNKSFCMAPWTHLHVSPGGGVFACCITDYKLGSIHESELEEIWNSKKLREIRTDMLAGQAHKSCSRCIHSDQLGKDSYRQYINRRLGHHVAKTDETAVNGSLPKLELNYVHFKFNNLCNLACRMCGPDASTSWHAVSQSLGNKVQKFPLIQSDKDNKLMEFVLENINDVDIIKFTGGEPLITPEFYTLLNYCISKGRTDIELFYNTNLTVLDYQKKSITDLWKKFDNITVGASLDAEGVKSEYLRSFSRWTDIVENRKRLQDQCPDITFFVSSVVTIINALHLPDFHRSWVEQKLINPDQFDISILTTPTYLRIHRTPEPIRQRIIDRYYQHLKWLEPLDHLGRASASFRAVIRCLETSAEEFKAQEFWHEINRLDQYHSTSLLTVFPELTDLPHD